MDPETEFRRLYDSHHPAVHAYFVGRTGDRQLAADLMQEVFTKAWQHLDRLRGMTEERRRAWIFTVARNLSIDSLRRKVASDGLRESLARERSFPSDPASSDPASAAVISDERTAVVAEAVARLPQQQRVALSMAAAGEMTSAGIASVLGVPAGTVRYWLSLARRSIAEALRRYDEGVEEA